MIDQSNALISEPPLNARWIYDAIIRQIKPKSTYHDFMVAVVKSITPRYSFNPKCIVFINDIYRADSINSLTRLHRGQKSTHTYIKSLDQKNDPGKEVE